VWTAIAIGTGTLAFTILQLFTIEFREHMMLLAVLAAAIPYLVGSALCISLASLDIWRRTMILGSLVGAAAYIAQITAMLTDGGSRLLPIVATLAIVFAAFHIWCVVATMMLHVRRKSRYTRWSVNSALVLMAAGLVVLATIIPRILFAETTHVQLLWEQQLEVAIGPLVIVVLVVIYALLALMYEQGVFGPVPESLREEMECPCPRCRRPFKFKSHGAHCPTCGLSIRVIPS
jgi:Zn finger protein HypA/HybF involved in hydrogenase expression